MCHLWCCSPVTRLRVRSPSQMRLQKKVTRLILTVISVYIICWLPHWLTQLTLVLSSPGTSSKSFKTFCIWQLPPRKHFYWSIEVKPRDTLRNYVHSGLCGHFKLHPSCNYDWLIKKNKFMSLPFWFSLILLPKQIQFVLPYFNPARSSLRNASHKNKFRGHFDPIYWQ